MALENLVFVLSLVTQNPETPFLRGHVGASTNGVHAESVKVSAKGPNRYVIGAVNNGYYFMYLSPLLPINPQETLTVIGWAYKGDTLHETSNQIVAESLGSWNNLRNYLDNATNSKRVFTPNVLRIIPLHSNDLVKAISYMNNNPSETLVSYRDTSKYADWAENFERFSQAIVQGMPFTVLFEEDSAGIKIGQAIVYSNANRNLGDAMKVRDSIVIQRYTGINENEKPVAHIYSPKEFSKDNIYDITGRRTGKLQRGINFVRQQNGKFQKVIRIR